MSTANRSQDQILGLGGGRAGPPLRRGLNRLIYGDARPLTGSSVLQALGLWIVIAAVVGAGTWFAIGALVPAWMSTNVPVLVVVAEVYAALPIAALLIYGPDGLRDRVHVRYTSIRDLWLGVGVWALVMASSALIYMALGVLTGSIWQVGLQVIRLATDMARLPSASGLEWSLILVRACLLAGIAEELLFRGLLFGWLRQRFSARTTILVTTVVFTLEHYYLVIFPVVFIYGLSVGWLRERTGSVLPGLVTHVLSDSLLLLIAVVLTLEGVSA